MTKRQKIVITSIIGSAFILGAMLTNIGPGIAEVAVITGLVYLLSAWALQPGLSGIEYATLLALPTLLTLGVTLTAQVENLPIPGKYFLPLGYGAGLYLILLAENIFNVSAARGIPLLRAAQTIGYLLTLGTAFGVSGLLFSRHFPSYLNLLAMFLIGGAAVGQALWQVTLDETNRRKLVLGSLVSAICTGELALVISFWPVHPLAAGLALTTMVYLLIGLIQHDWQGNLNRRAVAEYLLVGIAVLLLLIFTTSWSA